MTETLEMQLRSAKLTLLVDLLLSIEHTLAWLDLVEAATDVERGRQTLELHYDALIGHRWPPVERIALP